MSEAAEKKMLFVYNPYSGKGQIGTYLSDVLNVYTSGGYCVTVHPTQRSKDGHDYILEHLSEYDVISVCGGDGMLNEAVGALLEKPIEQRKPLAYIPAGSTNDFASTVGIPSDLKQAAEMVISGKPFICDGGRFNDASFAYVAAFGAFTSVAYDTAQEFKNIFGHLAYVLEAIKQLPSIKSHRMKITYDGKTIEDEFLFGMITNSMQVAGIKHHMRTAVSLNDGLFEVLLIKKTFNPVEIQATLTSLLSQDLSSGGFISFKASKITVESEVPVSWTLDGEFGGDCTYAEVENLPRAFAVII